MMFAGFVLIHPKVWIIIVIDGTECAVVGYVVAH